VSYWLVKSEPEEYSIQDLRKKSTGWEGVRNYLARNYMRDLMKLGDLVLFYHSNAEPSGIAGIARVSKESHPDPSQFERHSDYFDPKSKRENPTWMMVELEFVEEFSSLIPLEILKAQKGLEDMPLVKKGTRLSVMPVKPAEFELILKLAKTRTKT
jgi:predicted RNA-binding protein with PUA-like domain